MSTSARHYCSSTTKLPAYTKLVLTTISKNLLLSYHRLAAPHGLEPIEMQSLYLLTYLLTYLLYHRLAAPHGLEPIEMQSLYLTTYLLTTLLYLPYLTLLTQAGGALWPRTDRDAISRRRQARGRRLR